VVNSIEAMRVVRGIAEERGLKVHLDGARIFNAAAATAPSAKEYCDLCDSVMFCLSKGLGAPIGSMVTGDAEFMRQARRYRKLLGGGMRQVGVIAAAGIYALRHNIDRLADDHRRARRLAESLARIESLGLDLDSVQTNIVVVDVARSGRTVEECLLALEKQGVLVVPFGRTTIRAVTHLDIDDEDIETAVSVFDKVFKAN
jgi:threonine aldolase